MITLKDVAILDRNAELLGIPASQLMENAGRGLARLINEKYVAAEKNMLILCGTGNNGGDGFVAARYLSLLGKVAVVVLGPEEKLRTELTRQAFASLQTPALGEENLKLFFLHELERATLIQLLDGADIIVDAMLGSGISGELREPYKGTIKLANTVIQGQETKVVAVDVPTGWKGANYLHPDMVVTFHDLKEGYCGDLAGITTVVDIGIPPEAQVIVNQGHLLHLPVLRQDTRKGMRGSVLVIGGGPYPGAPVLAALGASETGIDLIHLAVPDHIFPSTAGASPNFIVHALKKPGTQLTPAHLPQIYSIIARMNAIVLGPGLGRNKETLHAVMKLLETDREKEDLPAKHPVPCLLDADALYAISKNMTSFLSLRRKLKKPLLDPLILTPHQGEFRRLLEAPGLGLGERDIKDALTGREFRIQGLVQEMKERLVECKVLAKKTHCIVLSKGPWDIISDGHETRINITGNPTMSVGGTGDVLAGVCAGFLAQGIPPLEAASLGAYINGLAGELSTTLRGRSMRASDLVLEISEVLASADEL